MLSPQATTAAKAITAALPAPAAPRTGSAGSAGPSFSDMLTAQAPATPPAPPPAAAPVPTPTHADAAPREPAPANAAPKPAAQAKPAANNGTAKPTAQAQDKTKADAPADTKKAAATDDKTAKDDGDDKTETAGLDEFTSLIGMAAGTATPADAAAAAAAQAAEAAEAAKKAPIKAPPGEDNWDPSNPTHATGQANVDNSTANTHAGHHLLGDASAQAAEAAKAKAGELAGGHEKASQGTAALQESTQALDTAQAGPRAPNPADAPLPTSFAASLQAAVTNAAPAATGTATSANIGAPVHSPAFAPEMAASVSLMAVDGVQHAELQLNPTDMGPVSVQIVLDGSQVQVSFHAAQADTRQALEKSLPDLAAALQGQGLTLSGGGVFQQAQQQQQNGSDSGNRGNASANGSRSGSRLGGGGDRVAGTASAPVRRQVGLVDTFA